MCCCGRPTRNDEPGYRWQPNDKPTIRGVNAPELQENETLLFDEPGRCGGVDSHSHHYRVISSAACLWLLVRHGGGDERMRLSNPDAVKAALQALDSTGRYWLLNAIFHAQRDAEQNAQQITAAKWRQAAAEKRIRVSKRSGVKILPKWWKLTFKGGTWMYVTADSEPEARQSDGIPMAFRGTVETTRQLSPDEVKKIAR